MATKPPLLTPADLFRDQVLTNQSRRYGPAGLAAGIGSIGTGYGDMNREVAAGAASYDALSRSLANEAAGLPRALAGQQTATALDIGDAASQRLSTRRTIEAAYQAAIAAGLKPGTRAFNEYMVSHVNTYDAASRITPEIAKGNVQAQTQDLQAKSMKSAIDKYIKQQVVNQYVSEHKNEAIVAADANPNGMSRQQAIQQLVQYAGKLGDQVVQQAGVQVAVDPDTGFIKAMDMTGKPFEVPPSVLAAGYAMAGNQVPFNVFEKLTKDQQAAVRQMNLNQRTAGLLQHYDTEANKALAPPKAPVKEVLDPYTQERAKRFHNLEKTYATAETLAAKQDGTAVPIPKWLQTKYDQESAWYESVFHNRGAPASAVVTGTDVAGNAGNAQAPASYDYGADYGADYSDLPPGPEAMSEPINSGQPFGGVADFLSKLLGNQSTPLREDDSVGMQLGAF